MDNPQHYEALGRYTALSREIEKDRNEFYRQFTRFIKMMRCAEPSSAGSAIIAFDSEAWQGALASLCAEAARLAEQAREANRLAERCGERTFKIQVLGDPKIVG